MVIAALVMVLTGCTQNKKEMNTLVAYFSATGTTEAVAKDLAEVAGARCGRHYHHWLGAQ